MKVRFENIEGVAYPVYGTWHCFRCEQIARVLAKGLNSSIEVLSSHHRKCPFFGYENTDVFRHEFYTQKLQFEQVRPPRRSEAHKKAERLPELRLHPDLSVKRKPPARERTSRRTARRA
jgi:hypothetical protein